jgi:hypothetical protein
VHLPISEKKVCQNSEKEKMKDSFDNKGFVVTFEPVVRAQAGLLLLLLFFFHH